jgi:sensor domain CHASE-containing protein
MPRNKIRIAFLLVFVFIGLLLVGSIVVVAVVNSNFQQLVLEEAKAKTRLIQDRREP